MTDLQHNHESRAVQERYTTCPLCQAYWNNYPAPAEEDDET